MSVPVALVANPGDTDVFESPDGSSRYVLPRYALAFDRSEPRLAIGARDGVPTLLVTLLVTPSPAAGAAGALELPHELGVTLSFVVNGDVQKLPFTRVTRTPGQDVVSAELLLSAPGQQQQVLAALATLGTNTTLTVSRRAQIAVPTGVRRPDGTSGYVPATLALDLPLQPSPLVLSEEQRRRLGGEGASLHPLIRHTLAFRGKSHTYWQERARPGHFYHVPDAFWLARAPEPGRRLRLQVSGAARSGSDVPYLALAFEAQPVTNPERLREACVALDEAAPQGVESMEVFPDAQPLLRLALPEGGAPSARLTQRPDTQIDLEAGLNHVETLSLDDFRIVYEALFGASLGFLHGEVRVAIPGEAAEDVPLELRVDQTAGDVLEVSAGEPTADGAVSYRFTNAIESPVRIDRLGAQAFVQQRQVTLAVEGLGLPLQLEPGASASVRIRAPEATPPAQLERLRWDFSGVAVVPDAEAIWRSIFDRSAAEMDRRISVEAFPGQFTSPAHGRVLAFVVHVKGARSVRVTESAPVAETSVRVPLEPLILQALRQSATDRSAASGSLKFPLVQWETETVWESGVIGRASREVDGTLLVPQREPN